MQQELVNTRRKSATYTGSRIIVNDQASTAETTQHPLAGTRMSGADMVVQVLADEGVDAIFGYSGKVELLTRVGDRFTAETLFVDRDKGHWLARAELDGRNETDELLLSGYGSRIVLLTRPRAP